MLGFGQEIGQFTGINSSLPRELAAMNDRSSARATMRFSPDKIPRRSAEETTFSALAIEQRTETPEL